MARSGRLRRPGRGLGSDDQLKPRTGCGTTLGRWRFRLIVDGWATFQPGACAPLRRTFDAAVSPSTIRLKRASTIAEIRIEPFALPRWRESAGLREFVVSFGRLLPLHLPSSFGDKDMIQKLMAYSGGLTGRMTTLLAQAAELAIRQKTECISLALLDQAASAGIFRIPMEEETDDAVA